IESQRPAASDGVRKAMRIPRQIWTAQPHSTRVQRSPAVPHRPGCAEKQSRAVELWLVSRVDRTARAGLPFLQLQDEARMLAPALRPAGASPDPALLRTPR